MTNVIHVLNVTINLVSHFNALVPNAKCTLRYRVVSSQVAHVLCTVGPYIFGVEKNKILPRMSSVTNLHTVGLKSVFTLLFLQEFYRKHAVMGSAYHDKIGACILSDIFVTWS